MYLCELYNLTVGIPAYKLNNLVYTDDGKTVKGIVGKEFQLFFKSRKNYPSNCKMINIYNVGTKLKNGSYDGALGAIDRKEIDLFFRAEIPFTDNQNVYPSYPVNTEEFFIYQIIRKKELDDAEFRMQLVKSFSLDFLLCYFLASFFFVLFLFFFYLNILKFFQSNQPKILIILKVFRKISFKKFKCFSLIFFGIVWFDFLTKQIMTNNIKTSKVIVDTSELIVTEKDVFNSPLKAAWLEGESDFSLAKNAPKNTFLYKLYLYKNDFPVKFFQKTFDIDTIEKINGYFFFIKNYLLRVGIGMLSSYQNGDGFVNEKPFYSVFTVFYISKIIDKRKIDFVFKISQFVGQSGLSLEFVKRLYSSKIFDEGPRKNKIYTNINSYIKDFTKFDSLKYESFYYFFLAFFCFNFSLSTLYIVHFSFINIKYFFILKTLLKLILYLKV